MGLGRIAVNVGIETEIVVAPVGLRVVVLPGRDLILVDHDLAVLDPALELLQHLGIGVLADAAVEPVVPAVEPADQIVAVDMAVRHQGAAMQAAAIEHGDPVIVADDHKVDIGGERVGRGAVLEIAQGGDGDFVHFASSSISSVTKPARVGISDTISFSAHSPLARAMRP